MKQLSVIMVSFLSGYLSATIFDLTSLSGWMNSHFSSKSSRVIEQAKLQEALPKPKFEFYTILANDKDVHRDAQSAVVSKASTAELPAAPTGIPGGKEAVSHKAAAILADHPVSKQNPVELALPAPHTHVASNQPKQAVVAPVPEHKAPVAMAPHDTYLVQIAAYKTRQDAERLKANLVLKGYDVQIALVTQQNASIYRVVLGPFDSRDKASKAQLAIAQSERINGMIRRSDV